MSSAQSDFPFLPAPPPAKERGVVPCEPLVGDVIPFASMRALTLTQPWASLVALAAVRPDLGKHVETRGRAMNFRGPLAIHAGAGLGQLPQEVFEGICRRHPFAAALRAAGFASPADLPRGRVVAVCFVTDCRRVHAGIVPPEPERSFGDYTLDGRRHAISLADIRALAEPVPARGTQTLWTWTVPPGTALVPTPTPGPQIGKEYWVLQQHATLQAVEGTEAVMLNRWDQTFRVDIGELGS